MITLSDQRNIDLEEMGQKRKVKLAKALASQRSELPVSHTINSESEEDFAE
jgi:hypothetical protein